MSARTRTEEEVFAVFTSESWTEGGRRQETKVRRLESLGERIWMWVQGSCRLPCFMATRGR